MKLCVALLCLVAASTSTVALAEAPKPAPTAAEKAAEARATALMEALRKLHKGQGPCYRWDRRSGVTEETIASTAVMLKDKKIKSEELMSVTPLFIKWADDIDKKAHALSERDEFRKTVRELAPPDEQAKLDKNPQALEELADKVVSRPVDATKAQAAFDKLSKAKQAAIKDVFKAHPAALRLSFVDVVVALKKLETPTGMTEQQDDHGHAH